MEHKVVPFPHSSSSPFRPAHKRGAPKLAEIRASITSNLPRLIEDVQLEIVSMWRRGVQIALIAKMHQITVRQAEAVIWVAYNEFPDPHRPTVRQARAIHLVSRAA